MKRYIGLGAAGHDSSICVMNDDGRVVLYSQAERLSRKKNDFNLGDLRRLFDTADIPYINESDIVYCSDPERAYSILHRNVVHGGQKGVKDYSFKRIAGMTSTENIMFASHHMAHAASSFMFREEITSDAIYFAYDGVGITSHLKLGHFSFGLISENNIQECVLDHNEVYSPRARLERLPLPNTIPLHVSGKIMGLAGYLNQDNLKYIPVKDVSKTASRYHTEGLSKQVMLEYRDHYYSFIQDATLILNQNLERFPQASTVVVGGGAFLALELNTFLVERGKRLIFGPPINDSGLSIGLAALAYFQSNGKFPPPIDSPFIQWGPKEDSFNYLSPKKAAELLVDQNTVIGLIQGQAEAGPRALGHRSLLATPSTENRKLLSEDIKGREVYRPVAPIVTDRDFSTWFTGPRGKYMQFRNGCLSKAKETVPGIVHQDMTARVQVLNPQINPWLYDVLCEVGKKTGAECLINTSLNGRGSPICNTLAEAQKELNGKNILFTRF
jgi:predicted NodU family carbamoyl transferase